MTSERKFKILQNELFLRTNKATSKLNIYYLGYSMWAGVVY